MRLICALLAAIVAATSGAARAEGIGSVVDFVQGATLTRADGTRDLRVDQRLEMADVIRTDTAGRVQLLFDDGTRIAIGPKSTLIIDQVLMKSSGRASRFAVTAASGTMRFITGKSAKSAYSITTPTATMGIRGTAFDVAVSRKKRTDVVLFKGQVQLCGAGGCRPVDAGCQAVGVTSVGVFDETVTDSQKSRLIIRDFPLIVNQDLLRKEYRQPLERCGERVVAQVQAVREPKRELRDDPEPQPPAPPPPPPPPPPI